VADELSGEGTYKALKEAMTPPSDAATAYRMAIGLDA
jgi:hypothetical protein